MAPQKHMCLCHALFHSSGFDLHDMQSVSHSLTFEHIAKIFIPPAIPPQTLELTFSITNFARALSEFAFELLHHVAAFAIPFSKRNFAAALPTPSVGDRTSHDQIVLPSRSFRIHTGNQCAVGCDHPLL